MVFTPQSDPYQLDQCSSLVDILRYRASHQPNQVAYIGLEDGESESGRLTYQQLDWQARRIAGQLQSLGAANTRVLLTYPLSEGLAFTAAFFGCLYAGAIAVTAWPPLNESLLAELQYKAADSEAMFGLTTQPLLTKLQEPFTAAPPLAELQWIATDVLTDAKTDAKIDTWRSPHLSAETLAYLQYTSGSTGLPKGAMISHGNVLDNLGLIYQTCQYGANDIGVCWLPLYHDMGLVGAVIQPVYAGGPAIMMSPVDFILKPLRWLKAISHYRATTSGGPNFAYELCIRKTTPAQRADLDLSCWAIAANGAEPVLAETLARFATAFKPSGFRPEAFCPAYGMAETTVMVSLSPRNASPTVQSVQPQALEKNWIKPVAPSTTDSETQGRKVVGCGQVGKNHTVVIVDPDTLTRCATDQIGEIWLAGPSVAQGYWNRPEETQQTFKACLADTGEGPFLRTGDMGFLQNNELFITGRLKDVIILWGNNHYPHFLEMTVEKSHPALRPGGIAVFGVEVEGEERLVVVQEVESRHLKTLDVNAVITAIRQSLATYHMLEAHAIVLVRPGSTPKTPTGKTQRAACRAKFLADELNIIEQWQHSHIAKGILLDPALAIADP